MSSAYTGARFLKTGTVPGTDKKNVNYRTSSARVVDRGQSKRPSLATESFTLVARITLLWDYIGFETAKQKSVADCLQDSKPTSR